MAHALKQKIPSPGRWLRDTNLGQAWLVLALAILFGAALAAVQVNLSRRIEANRQNETLSKIPELVWGPARAREIKSGSAAVQIIPGTLQAGSGANPITLNLFKVIHAGQLAGWVIKAGGQGYAEKIDLLIGIDPQVSALTGLFVLDQKETPGLGNKITAPGWRGQFKGRSTGRPLTVAAGLSGSEAAIDAITGATISSRSVTRIVNRVMAAVKDSLEVDTFRPIERRS